MDADPRLDEDDVRSLLEAIHAQCGYDLRGYSATSMRRRLEAVLARSGLAGPGELRSRVLADEQYAADVVDQLTIQVSDLFRDPSFYRALRERVVPVLHTYPVLRLWSAGCAFGEEAYTCAIVLAEEGLAARSQIYATDLSARALAQAKQGVYPADRLPAFEDNYRQAGGTGTLDAYYTAAYDGIAMRDSVRRTILFFQHNLVTDQVFGEMHVVFCRNVLIYFAKELRQRVLAKLRASLCPGGFLCLGRAERLAADESQGAFSDFASGERIYRYEG